MRFQAVFVVVLVFCVIACCAGTIPVTSKAAAELLETVFEDRIVSSDCATIIRSKDEVVAKGCSQRGCGDCHHAYLLLRRLAESEEVHAACNLTSHRLVLTAPEVHALCQ